MTMREILFRGKFSEKSRWSYGVLYEDQGKVYIATRDTMHGVRVHEEVIRDTVGQFTGLVDKNGKKIFEGDVVVMTLPAAKMHWRAVCKFHSGAFGLVWHHMGERWQAFAAICNAEYEVIGNVHDNPELAEDK